MTDVADSSETDNIEITWRGTFTSREANALHAEAFETRVFAEEEWDWEALCERHSLGWVTARLDAELIGFLNVPWDGFTHAWLQDVMVSAGHRRRGVGVRIVHAARDAVRAAGCEHLHVDFKGGLAGFYVDACGFTPSSAGLISFD